MLTKPRSGYLLVALATFAAVAIGGVALRPLLPVDETRYMSVAWEMWQSGNYLVPHMNGAIYPHKPPLLFWLINLVWSLAGVSETAGRLVGPAAALAAIALTALLGRRMWPEDAGLGGRAALVLASSGLFLAYGSLTMFDALLTAAALVSLIALVEAWRSGRVRWWLLYGLGIGLGVLAKGPVIAVHVLPAALLMPLWAGRERRPALRSWYLGLLLGLAAALALVLPWLLPAVLTGGAEYRDAVLWQQSAGRIVNSFAHRQPFWFFAALLPLILWPWLWWPPLWKPLRATVARPDPMLRLCLVWLAATLTVLSLISGKQLHYILPVLPAVALVVGRAIGGLSKAPRAGILPALLPVLVALGLLLAIAGELIEVHRLGKMEDAIELQFTALEQWLIAVALVLGGLLLAARHWQAVASVAPLLVAVVSLFGVNALEPFYDGNKFARVMQERQDAGLAFIGGHYQGEFTFLGRLRVPVTELEGEKQLQAWAAAHPRGAIIGSTKQIVPDWPATLSSPYRGKQYGVWIVPPQAAMQRGLAEHRAEPPTDHRADHRADQRADHRAWDRPAPAAALAAPDALTGFVGRAVGQARPGGASCPAWSGRCLPPLRGLW